MSTSLSSSFLLLHWFLCFGDVGQDALHGGLYGGKLALLSLKLLIHLSLHLLLGILDLDLHEIDLFLHAFDLLLDDVLLVLRLVSSTLCDSHSLSSPE